MTAWIGLRPSREAGVVVLADTMGSFIDRETGRETYGRDERKVRWIYGHRILNVISGITNDQRLEMVGIVGDCALDGRPPSDTRDRIRETYGRIKSISDGIKQHHLAVGHRPVETPNRADGGGPQVLFAGGPEGTEPVLAKITPSGETWAEPGDVLSSGSWLEGVTADIAAEMHHAPETLAGCRAVAAGWIRRVLLKEFGTLDLQETLRSGWVPSVGFPLVALTVTADNIHREEIKE